MELSGTMTLRSNAPQSTLGKWENLMDKSEIPKFSKCNSQKFLENRNSQRTINPCNELNDNGNVSNPTKKTNYCQNVKSSAVGSVKKLIDATPNNLSGIRKNGKMVYKVNHLFEPNFSSKTKRISSAVDISAIRSNKEFAGVQSNKNEIDKKKFNIYSRAKAAQNFNSKIFEIGKERVNKCEVLTEDDKGLLRHQTQRKIKNPKKGNIDEIINNTSIKNKEVIKTLENAMNLNK